MNVLIVLCSVLGLACAIVCPPNYCDDVKQPLLDCKGGVIENAGFCGCTDICAKVEGEICRSTHFFGIPNTQICDEGLECVPFKAEGYSGHKCVNKTLLSETVKAEELTVSRKAINCMTPCQKKSQLCTFSFVIYEGQWFSKCDDYGNFLPQQCDNTKHCFCVDVVSGEIQEGSKTLGSANC